jgi:hypothetical protein
MLSPLGSAVINNAKRNNRIIDLDTLEENVSKVKNYCSDEKSSKYQS